MNNRVQFFLLASLITGGISSLHDNNIDSWFYVSVSVLCVVLSLYYNQRSIPTQE